MSSIIAYIGLGSNLSNPIEQLKTALNSIDALPSTRLLQSSSFYGSKPLGPQDQPDFVNAVSISKQSNMYAYDAYFLDCALRMKAPLLTLDAKLKKTARQLNISILEV